MDVPLLAFSFLLGANAFFSPCGFPMLPAYLAYYLPRGGTGPHTPLRGLARGLAGGALAALGAVAVLGAVGLLAATLGAPFKARVADLELVGGLVTLALGILTLAGRGPAFAVALQPARARSAWALVGFGALYAAVAASCVAPLLLSVLVQAFVAPTLLEGALVVLAYAAGLALLLVAATVLVALAQETVLRAMRRALPWIARASGVILVLVGLYVLWYWRVQLAA
ncbi:MAG: cytochrome c-type biosis protein [Thermoplasmata archaeon]|jgi:cytochrome c biogenesis protein CcdA|nr:cytochrome c-type biosis protein [Thermoplasmata archaeon]